MVEPRKKIIGILGGSFDPVHKGHVKISKITIKKIKIDKLYWVITKKNPFKKQTFFSLKKRIEYAKKAVSSLKKIQPYKAKISFENKGFFEKLFDYFTKK